MSKKNRVGRMLRTGQHDQKTTEEISTSFFKDKEEGKFDPVPLVKEDVYDPFEEAMREAEQSEKEETVVVKEKEIIKENKQEKIGGKTMKNNNAKIENGFTRPLSLEYGVTSLEFLNRFKAILAEKMPEVAECAAATTIAVQETVRDGVKANQVKFVLKLDLTRSQELKRDNRASFDTSADPQFEALFEKSLNDGKNFSENYKKMPKYMQEKGKGILYNDYFDVIKFEPFRNKEGKVWENLVLLEVNVAASILHILDLDTKLYVGYVGNVVRMKQLEESLKLKQKMKGQTGIQVPTIYLIQVKVDDIEILKASSSMFEKPKYQQGVKGGNNYKSALAEFIGR